MGELDDEETYINTKKSNSSFIYCITFFYSFLYVFWTLWNNIIEGLFIFLYLHSLGFLDFSILGGESLGLFFMGCFYSALGVKHPIYLTI